MNRTVFFLSVLLVSTLCGSGVAASFQILDATGWEYIQAHDISADGVSVAGHGWTPFYGHLEAFRWTADGGTVNLGDLPGLPYYSEGYAISDDGFVVVGSSRYGTHSSDFQAYRWTSGGGMVGLIDSTWNMILTRARDVSADGSVIVGEGKNSVWKKEAFRWTTGDEVIGLGDLDGGDFVSLAHAVSADGSVIVGTSQSASGLEAFRWTAGGGMAGLGDLPGGIFLSEAQGVSSDGSVVVGYGTTDSGSQAFRWTAGGGMVGLGDLPGGSVRSSAYNVSADGSVVVGSSAVYLGDAAFYWTASGGMRNLKEMLTNDYDLDLTGITLEAATAVSADGLTVIGTGTGPAGTLSWIADLSASENGNAWTKSPANPVLDSGPSGSIDECGVANPCVIKDAGGYAMWYSADNGSIVQICYATSSNGTDWNKYAGNPVLSVGIPGSWEDQEVTEPTVLKEGGLYKMWYAGMHNDVSCIGYATSPDGISWTKHAGNPVLTGGNSGSWDEEGVGEMSVMKDDGTYRMWYASSVELLEMNEAIGCAASPDGIHWTKYENNPVLVSGAGGTWDEADLDNPTVVKHDSVYHMWYEGENDSEDACRIGYAASVNGFAWTKSLDNPVLDIGQAGSWDESEVSGPCVLFENNAYQLWYSSSDGMYDRIGLAQASVSFELLDLAEMADRWLDTVPGQAIDLYPDGKIDGSDFAVLAAYWLTDE